MLMLIRKRFINRNFAKAHWLDLEQGNKKVVLVFILETSQTLFWKVNESTSRIKKEITFYITAEDIKQAYRFHTANDEKQRE